MKEADFVHMGDTGKKVVKAVGKLPKGALAALFALVTSFAIPVLFIALVRLVCLLAGVVLQNDAASFCVFIGVLVGVFVGAVLAIGEITS